MCDDHVSEEGQAAHLQAPPLPALTPGCRRCHGDFPQPPCPGQEGQAGPGNRFGMQHHFHIHIQTVPVKTPGGSLLNSVLLHISLFVFPRYYLGYYLNLASCGLEIACLKLGFFYIKSIGTVVHQYKDINI